MQYLDFTSRPDYYPWELLLVAYRSETLSCLFDGVELYLLLKDPLNYLWTLQNNTEVHAFFSPMVGKGSCLQPLTLFCLAGVPSVWSGRGRRGHATLVTFPKAAEQKARVSVIRRS